MSCYWSHGLFQLPMLLRQWLRNRPYWPALGIHTALQEITEHSNDYFDAEVVTASVNVFHENGYINDNTRKIIVI